MSFDLLLAFDRDTDDFSHGFEAGRIWELLKDDAENVELVMRMAEALDLTIAAEFTSDDSWMLLKEGRVQP